MRRCCHISHHPIVANVGKSSVLAAAWLEAILSAVLFPMDFIHSLSLLQQHRRIGNSALHCNG